MADEKSTVLGIRLDTEERKRFDEFVGEEGKNNKDFLNGVQPTNPTKPTLRNIVP